MAELPDIVNVSIRRETVYPTQPGFGTACLLVLHTFWSQLARRFTSLKELTDLGVTTKHRLYRMAAAHLSSKPTPAYFIVGKRTRSYTQILKLTPLVLTAGYVYAFQIVETDAAGAAGVTTDVTYTVQPGDTADSIITAFIAILDPLTTVAAVNTSHVCVVTVTAGDFVILQGLPPLSELKVEDATADPGIAADMAAVVAEADLDDSKSFFAWAFDRTGKAEGLAAAAAIEASKKVGIVEASDSVIADGNSTTDLAAAMKSAAYSQTIGIFAQYGNGTFRGAAWEGSQLPYPVGSNTWAFKTLPGVFADKMLSGEASAVEAKNWSTYRKIGGVNVTFESKTPSGEFFDLIIGTLELESALQFACFGEEVTRRKIPFTDHGIAILGNRATAVLSDRTEKGPDDPKLLTSNPAPLVILPKASDISPSNKAARILDPPIQFSATYAGAIHRVKIAGTIGV
jgi:hypothetical protein